MREKLINICTPRQWKTLSTSELKDEGYRVYGANGVIGYYDEYNHEAETVMVTCRGATCGTVNISRPYSYINGNAMCMDDLRQDIDVKYLYYSLKQYDFREVISGSAQPQITRQGLNNVFVEVVDKPRQLEIVKVLSNVEETISRKQQQLKEYDQLIKSRFVEMFGDPQDDSFNFPEYKIGDTCFVTKLAGYEYTKYIKYQETGEVVMVKAQNVKNGALNKKDLSYISLDVSDKLSRSQLKSNDLVMTYVGANIGDLAIIDDENKYHLAPNVALIRPYSMLNPVFFMYFLMFKREYILGNSADTAKGAIGMEKIRKLNIFVPRIEDQNQFAKIVKQIDKLKFVVQKSLEETKILFNSLMQKYFG